MKKREIKPARKPPGDRQVNEQFIWDLERRLNRIEQRFARIKELDKASD